jgi:hypothetical protein
MFVNAAPLGSGANEAHRTGGTPASAPIACSRLCWHRALRNVGEEALLAATGFTETDERDAARRRAVRCTSAT